MRPARLRAAPVLALLVALSVWISFVDGARAGTTTPALLAAALSEDEKPAPEAAEDMGAAVETAKGPFPEFLKEPVPVAMLAGNPFLPLPSEKVPVVPVRNESGQQNNPVSQSLIQEEKAKVAAMVVSCIVRCKRSSSCVVDGKLLFLGAEYKGFILKDIGEDFIVLAGEGGDHSAKIAPLKFNQKVVDKN